MGIDLQTQNTICGVRAFYLYLGLMLRPRTQDYGRNIWPPAGLELSQAFPGRLGETATLGQATICSTTGPSKLQGKEQRLELNR